jgi:hypothetical protein
MRSGLPTRANLLFFCANRAAAGETRQPRAMPRDGALTLSGNRHPRRVKPPPICQLAASLPQGNLDHTRNVGSEMSHLPYSAICLTPAARQGEFWASQYPDGSIVFSVRLKDERVQYLLVPPERIATRRRRPNVGHRRGTYHVLMNGQTPSASWNGRDASSALRDDSF